MVDETIFANSDNAIELILVDSTGIPYDFSSNGVTKVELFVGCQKFDSDSGGITFADGGILTIKLGGETSIANNINFSCSIKAYDPSHPNGQFLVNNTMENSQLSLTKIDPSIC